MPANTHAAPPVPHPAGPPSAGGTPLLLRAPADETHILKRVQSRILSIRGQRVMVDADLVGLYGVPTLRLNEQIKRNAHRFPEDFAFRVTPEEKEEVIANCDRLYKLRFSPHLPLVFTKHGVIRPILGLTLWVIALCATVALRSCYGLIAAAFVLNAPRAVEVSTFVVRAFVQLRRMSSEVASLSQRLEALEQETARRFQDTEGHLRTLFQALRDLLNQSQTPDATPAPPKRAIGFRGQRK